MKRNERGGGGTFLQIAIVDPFDRRDHVGPRAIVEVTRRKTRGKSWTIHVIGTGSSTCGKNMERECITLRGWVTLRGFSSRWLRIERVCFIE